ncbi:type II secretion system protein J [Dechloromonas sp. HYN0024]|uniref:PulJ/GspJ family protein n=1 Tax=Dechloromonas sp. HYN0024 TaxID=2231055 RepID=UPI000E44602F|nr:type II secretion system protein [Dechloromonas sp. HYN0024]AXS79722.1 type II secretion system protein [Dechloromonas sp. HYN0024]
MKARGFSLIELIIVIMLMGIMAASVTIFFQPAVVSFIDARRRADMTDAADTALRRMAQDIRRAVPNSLNLIAPVFGAGNPAACFQIVPTVGGGRYRTDIDTAIPGADALNESSPAPFRMEILAVQGTPPAVGDSVVINNQNAADVYNGPSRAAITALGPPLTLASNPTVSGYMGGRFQVVSALEPSVIYTCSGGTLTRTVLPAFAAPAAACGAAGVLVADNIAGCTFTYGTAGATNGLLTMTLIMTNPANQESITLGYAVHVDNAP